METREGGGTKGALLVAGGAIVGAGLGLLFAPRSGRATRREIARYAESAVNGAVRVAEDASRLIAGKAGAVGTRTRKVLAAGIEARSRLLRRIA